MRQCYSDVFQNILDSKVKINGTKSSNSKTSSSSSLGLEEVYDEKCHYLCTTELTNSKQSSETDIDLDVSISSDNNIMIQGSDERNERENLSIISEGGSIP